MPARRLEGDLAHAATTVARDAGGGASGGAKTSLAEVGRVRKARGLTDNHTYPGSAIVARTELLHALLVEHGRGRRAILDEDLGKLPAVGQRFAKRPLEDVTRIEVDVEGHRFRLSVTLRAPVRSNRSR